MQSRVPLFFIEDVLMGFVIMDLGKSQLGKIQRLPIVKVDSGIPAFGKSGRWEVVQRRAYDLENRLVSLGSEVSKIATGLPPGRIATHISGQLIRCGMSPAPNYAEACSSESRRDLIHKLKICLKELRETIVWLKYLRNLEMVPEGPLEDAIREADELIAIFVTSIATARRNEKRKDS